MSVDSGSLAKGRAGSLVNNPWLDFMLPPRRYVGTAGGLTPVDREVAASPPAVAGTVPLVDGIERTSERTIGGIHGTAQAQTG